MPILLALVPLLIKVAEKIIPEPDKGSEKKEFVMQILSGLYDKFLSGVIPDLPAIDEKKIVLEILSHMVDFLAKKYFPS